MSVSVFIVCVVVSDNSRAVASEVDITDSVFTANINGPTVVAIEFARFRLVRVHGARVCATQIFFLR